MKTKTLTASLQKVAANGKAVSCYVFSSVTDQLPAEVMQSYRNSSQKAKGITESTRHEKTAFRHKVTVTF